MIATIFSSPASWLFWEFVVSLAASIGGLIVLKGLWLEGYKDKKEYEPVEERRREASRESRGKKWVFWGVLIEVILAFGMTFKDGLEYKELRKEIIRNDPRKQTIASVSAVAKLHLRGRQALLRPNRSMIVRDEATILGEYGMLQIGKWPAARTNNWQLELISDSFHTLWEDQADEGEYLIEFHAPIPMPTGTFNGTNLVESIDSLDSLSLGWYMWIYATNIEILKGSVILTANSVSKTFPIAPQKPVKGQIKTVLRDGKTNVWLDSP